MLLQNDKRPGASLLPSLSDHTILIVGLKTGVSLPSVATTQVNPACSSQAKGPAEDGQPGLEGICSRRRKRSPWTMLLCVQPRPYEELRMIYIVPPFD
jgi:hypothetical protein